MLAMRAVGGHLGAVSPLKRGRSWVEPCLQHTPTADFYWFSNSIHPTNPVQGFAEVFRAIAGVRHVGDVGIKRLQGRVLGLRHPVCGFLPLGIGT